MNRTVRSVATLLAVGFAMYFAARGVWWTEQPAVPLLMLDAEVELASKPNATVEVRRVPLREFFTGPGRTFRRASEILTSVRVPLPPDGFVAHFCKFGTRPALDISAVSIAIGCVRHEGVLRDVRVGVARDQHARAGSVMLHA